MKRKIKTGGSPVFFLKEGLKNIFVNGFMSFAAMSIIAICILIISSFTLVTLNITNEILKIKSESQIRVFISDDFIEQYEQIAGEIAQVSDVSSTIYISKEEALKNYEETLDENSKDILQGLEEDNPLPAGFVVYLNSLDNVDNVTTQLGEIDGIYKVTSQNETYKALNSLEKGFQIIALVLVIALGLVSIFIISNTVKLAMFARREEIGILKMIGAKNAFIRWPFVVEGLVLGVVGAILAYTLQWFIYGEFVTIIQQYMGFVSPIMFETIYIKLAITFLISGAVIGTSGSIFTIRKFLDV